MNQSTKTALAVVAVVALAGAFWLLLLGPKREKASELSEQTSSLRSEVATEQQRAAAALVAKRDFPRYYTELVLLGKAVPAEAATPSLLVQLNGVSAKADTSFQSIVAGGGGQEATASVPVAGEAGTLSPIGSTVGPAGLSAMPYELQFSGGFFGIADFIEGLNSLVRTKNGAVVAKGRLVTIDGFNLAPPSEEKEVTDELKATFAVNTYVTPPGQGLTAGATPAGPAPITPEQP
jgi:Tfp pilus assembly protein PilO